MMKILKYLSRSNKVTVFCPPYQGGKAGTTPYRSEISSVDIKYFDFTVAPRYALYNDFRVYRFLKNEYKCGTFDVLQLEISLGTFFLMRRGRFPKVGVFHTKGLEESFFMGQRLLSQGNVKDYLGLRFLMGYFYLCDKTLASKSNFAIAVSKEVKEYAANLGADPKNVFIAKNGVDLKEYQNYSRSVTKLQLRRKLGIREDSFVFVFHGSLESPQNVEAIKNIIRIRNNLRKYNLGDNYKFLIVGGPIDRLEKSSIMNSKDNDDVSFTGYVEDVKPYLFSADCGIAPFPQHAVSGGRLKIIEFLAAGLPVIATRTGVYGFEELIGDQPIYIIKNLKDFEKLLPLPEVEVDKTKLKNFDWSSIAAMNEKILKEALENAS